MRDDNPTLVELLEAAVEGRVVGMRTSLPGRIAAVGGGRATVQVLVTDASVDEDGERRSRPIATLPDVPVGVIGIGGGRLKFTPRVGDPCWLMFSSSSIARLKAGARGPVDPGDDRHHHLADAVVLPMSVFGDEEAEAEIEFTPGGLIRAGGDQPLVTRSEFLNHTHATAGAGTPSPPIIGGAPGSSVTFPGTSRLRG